MVQRSVAYPVFKRLEARKIDRPHFVFRGNNGPAPRSLKILKRRGYAARQRFADAPLHHGPIEILARGYCRGLLPACIGEKYPGAGHSGVRLAS
jgi:hypothetical protein